MKKTVFTLMVVLMGAALSFGQLTGNKSIPGDYATLQAAIAALNASGAGTGGVTFNIASGHTETFSNPTAGHITTLTGSISNPIVFQKSGAGNNPYITSGTGVGLTDAIISIAGCDYITFDGLNIRDKPTSVTANQKMEWGFAILKNSGTDGSQNITIKNCTVILDKNYDYTKGIHANNHTQTSTTQLTVTSFSGTNSNLKIFSNSLQNCYTGIYLAGFNHTSAPYNYYDQNNEIGLEGGNIINNVAGQTEPGYGIYTTFQNNLKVANNQITSVMGGLGSTAQPYGIYLSTAFNASYDLYNNYVSMQYSGSSDFYGIYSAMGGSGINNTVNIYNNTVTGCTYPNAVGGWIFYLKFINLGVITTAYNNVVSNNTVGSTSLTAVGRIDYMWFNKTNDVQGPMEIYNNSITGNIRFSDYIVGQPMYYLTAAGSGTTLLCYDNLIDNNITNSDHTINGLYVTFNDSEYKKVYNNTITNINEIRGSASGLYNYNGTLGYFYNNLIQGFKAKSSSPTANINGIYQAEYGKEMYFYNNMITNLENPGAEASSGYSWNMLNGIYIEASSNIRGFYNNTVYLNASITGNQSNYGSSALCGQYLSGVDLRNNILINTSTNKGPEGKTVAIRNRIPDKTGFTSNYNNLYAGTPGTMNLIYWDGATAAQTLLDYKNYIFPYELQSVTELSPFVNVAIKPWDVHLQNNVATQCESGGVEVSVPFQVLTDFDNEPRYPNPGYPVNPINAAGAPDIGADEVGGIPNDLTAPSITYTPLLNTYITGDYSRVLIAEIKDPSGVPASGVGKPVLYWKLNNGIYQGVQGQLIIGSEFSFMFSDGASVGDIISYFIGAQDMSVSPNVGVYPSVGASGFTANPPACTNPPSNPSTYQIIQQISGTFHVGVGKDYTTLTAAINDLNSKGVSGPLTFVLDDNSYPNETFPIMVNANAGTNAENTVTIRANTGAFPLISSSVPNSGLIILKGIDYLIIDGSDGQSATKRITFENTSFQNFSHVITITNNPNNDPSTNITLKNLNVLGNNSDIVNETYLIRFNVNGGTQGGGYDHITIDNNLLKRAKFAIDVSATSGNKNHNLIISTNTIGSPQAVDYITRWGIAVEQSDNTLIIGNDIMGPATTVGTYDLFGILYYNYTTNTKITNNKIHDWVSTGPGSKGIKCQNDDPTTFTEISNNLIYNIGAFGLNPGVSANHANGIFVRHGGNLRIWNNNICLTGDYLYGGDSFAPSSSCITFWNQTSLNSNQIDIRNNILQNSMTNSFPNPDPSAMGKAYGIMITDKVTISHLDNNDYYIDGYQGQIAQKYCVGGVCLENFPTLASWQAFTGMEANSVTVNPQFTSPTDLLPTTTLMNNAGVYIPSVPTDYVGNYRSNPCDIGAYEFAHDQVMNLNLLLEGAFNPMTNQMDAHLSDYLPTAQPYNPALPYFGNNNPTWIYAGTESIEEIPSDVVDWVVVELRDAPSAATAGPATAISGGTRAALLRTDGSITGVENNPFLIFAGVPVLQNLFVVIHHRNHLAVMTSGPVTAINGIYNWNFTTSQGQAYNNGQKILSADKFGMIGGDSNGDAVVDLLDKSAVWNIQAGIKGYTASDFDMNGEVANPDKNNIWIPNMGNSSSVQF